MLIPTARQPEHVGGSGGFGPPTGSGAEPQRGSGQSPGGFQGQSPGGFQGQSPGGIPKGGALRWGSQGDSPAEKLKFSKKPRLGEFFQLPKKSLDYAWDDRAGLPRKTLIFRKNLCLGETLPLSTFHQRSPRSSPAKFTISRPFFSAYSTVYAEPP